MKHRSKGRINGLFVPMLKDTMKTEAWRALSYGARSLYTTLKGRYNTTLQGAVYLSTRAAVKELSLHQHRTNVMSWFRELQYYGFIVMVSPAHHGVNGHGKAPHWRLTEEWHLGQAPTRDFLRWDGVIFHEQKSPRHYQTKNRTRGTDVRTTLERTCVPVIVQSDSVMTESGTDGRTIRGHTAGTDGRTITSLTTPCPSLSPSIAFLGLQALCHAWEHEARAEMARATSDSKIWAKSPTLGTMENAGVECPQCE
jgi:hypothetical protein